MIMISIRSADRDTTGFLRAVGHAGAEHGQRGSNLVCAAATAIFGALQSNLRRIDGLSLQEKVDSGNVLLEWSGDGESIKTANRAALFSRYALTDLSAEYPGSIDVRWIGGDGDDSC